MRIGDNDGYNAVYNPLGILIFETDEKLIKRLPDKELSLYCHRGSWILGDTVFWSEYGKGAFFITDRRIVFIRRPLDERKIIKAMRKYQGGVGPKVPFLRDVITHSRKVNEYGGFDFVEIRYEDIAFVRPQQIFLSANGKQYKSFIDRDVFQSMLPILGERNIRIEWGRFKRGKKIPIPKSKS